MVFDNGTVFETLVPGHTLGCVGKSVLANVASYLYSTVVEMRYYTMQPPCSEKMSSSSDVSLSLSLLAILLTRVVSPYCTHHDDTRRWHLTRGALLDGQQPHRLTRSGMRLTRRPFIPWHEAAHTHTALQVVVQRARPLWRMGTIFQLVILKTSKACNNIYIPKRAGRGSEERTSTGGFSCRHTMRSSS